MNSDSDPTALWEKFVLLATNSSVVALTRLPFGKLREDPEVFALFAKAAPRLPPWAGPRHHLAADLEEQTLQSNAQFSAGDDALDGRGLCAATGSNCPGLPARWWRWASELGVPTPTFEVMYAALKPYANGAPG